MRIAIITPYANPEKGAAVVRVDSFKESFESKNIEIFVLAPRRGDVKAIGVLRYGSVWHLMRLLAGIRPDVIIGTSPPIMHNLFALAAAKSIGSKFILDSKDPYTYLISRFEYKRPSRVKIFLYRAVEIITHKMSDHVFVLTPRDKEIISKEYGMSKRKILVAWNGSDIRAIRKDLTEGRRVRKSLGIRQDSFVLCYAGVIGGKDLDILLEKGRGIFAKGNICLLFIFTHDGTEYTEGIYKSFAGRVKVLGLESKVRVVFNIKYSDLYRYFSASDAALSPVPDFWVTNLPTKVFDYLAGELPVIAKGPKEGSMKDLFDRFDVGYYSTNWEGFLKCIEVASKDKKLKLKGKLGREVIKRYFARVKTNEAVLEAIKRVATS